MVTCLLFTFIEEKHYFPFLGYLILLLWSIIWRYRWLILFIWLHKILDPGNSYKKMTTNGHLRVSINLQFIIFILLNPQSEVWWPPINCFLKISQMRVQATLTLCLFQPSPSWLPTGPSLAIQVLLAPNFNKDLGCWGRSRIPISKGNFPPLLYLYLVTFLHAGYQDGVLRSSILLLPVSFLEGFLLWSWPQCLVSAALWRLSLRMITTRLTPEHSPPWSLRYCAFPSSSICLGKPSACFCWVGNV